MSGKSARTKGFGFERKISQDFQAMGWKDAGRQLEYQANEAHGYDLKNTDPFLVQCKKHKKYVPIGTIEEIEPQKGKIRLLITQGDYKEPMAVLSWKDLQTLICKKK